MDQQTHSLPAETNVSVFKERQQDPDTRPSSDLHNGLHPVRKLLTKQKNMTRNQKKISLLQDSEKTEIVELEEGFKTATIKVTVKEKEKQEQNKETNGRQICLFT